MSTPATRPRQTRRSSPASAGTRLIVLLLVLGGVAALLLLTTRAITGGEAAEATPSPTETPAAEPTITPEPTPALPAVDMSGWELRLIDYDHPLGEDYAPPELTDVGDNERLDSRVAPAALQLMADAKSAGYGVYVCSGYRDYDTQHSIYWNHIYTYQQQGKTEEEAHALTRLAVNYPGSSEHQSGMCVDILEYAGQPMEPYIGGSGLMLWLEQHCAEYGFVIRYPDGKTDITGVEYEPWHLRYVGKEAAAYIMENGLCLEEFLSLYSVG